MEKKVILIFVLAIFCLVSASSAYAEESTSKNNISYVDVIGNDEWDGSSSIHIANTNHGPKFNITNGVSVTNSGGSLYIASGVYSVSSEITIGQNLNIFGAGMNSTIIDGGNVTRIFNINSGNHVNITNLTIRNGKLSQAGDKDNGHNGGGIYNDGTLIIDGCNIYNNVAGKGGNASGATHNAGHGGNGGGIYNSDSGSLTITNSLIHDNTAGQGGTANGDNPNGGSGGSGGGIANDGHLNITANSTYWVQIYNNNAGEGGHAYNFDSKGGNGGNGGAIYNTKDCIVNYVLIYNNNGGKGSTYTSDKDHGDIAGGNGGDGGAFYNSGTLNLIDCIITNNCAYDGYDGVRGGYGGDGGNGGAVYNTKSLNITNCQITDNIAGDGGDGGDKYYYSTWKTWYGGGDGGLGGSGGAIYNSGSGATLAITGSSIIQNDAGCGGHGGQGGAVDVQHEGNEICDPGNGGNGGNGGGISNCNSGTINYITNTHIDYNTAGKGGSGGVYEDDIVDVEKVHVAVAGIGGSGGGIFSDAIVTLLQNTTINNNIAGDGGAGNPISRYPAENGGAGGNGGGLVIQHSTQISFCQINNNKAGNGGNGGNRSAGSDNNPSTDCGNGGNGGIGGGIYYYYSDNSDTRTITITNSTLNNNTNGNGGNGGIDDYDGSKSSNGGNGGSGGAIAIISKDQNSKPSQNLHLTVEECTIAGNQAGYGGQPSNKGTKGSNGFGGGIYTNDYHYFQVEFCRIIDNTPQAVYLNIKDEGYDQYLQFINNWWGSNSAPKGNVTTCSGTTMYTNYYTPWIVLSINATPNPIYPNQVSVVTANLTMNSNNQSTTSYKLHVPDDIPVIFSSNMGSMNPQNSITTSGISDSTFIPGSAYGTAIAYATVDYQTVNTNIHIMTAGVDINKTVNNTRPNVGENITFTVTATNNGPDNATGLVITDLIPQGLSNLVYTASTGQNTYSLTTGIWNIGQLLNGATATLNITGTVTAALAGLNVTNYANLTALNEANPNISSANASFYVPCVNVTVFQHPWCFDFESKAYQAVSSFYNVIVYNVDVMNTGADEATGVVIKDVLGDAYEFVGLSTEGVGTASYDTLSRTITWNIASLPKNTMAILSIFALVVGTGNNTPNVLVNASLDHVDQYDIPDSRKWSNWTVYVGPAADIQVNQTQQVSNEVDGQYVTYTITATNIGPDDANAVQITDNLPTGLINPIILQSLGTFTISSNKVVWTISSLVKGSNAVLIIKSKINATGTFVNTATRTSQADGELDWNHNNNAQTCILTLSGNYTPEVNMVVDQQPWFYNDLTNNPQVMSEYYKTIVYNVIVKNTGPTDATGVMVKEFLGDGYQFISCTTRGAGTAAYDNGTITWNIGYMPSGGKVVLTVFALVIATGNNTPDLTVNASLSHVDQYDIPGANKWASYSVYVPVPVGVSIVDNQANLYLNTILSSSNHNLGELFTVKFKLGNVGPDNATNVKIKIPIPEGFQFVSASVDVGHCYYVAATRTLIWELPVVEVGDPYLDLNLIALTEGNYALRPIIISTTYLLSAGDVVTPFGLNIASGSSDNGNSVNGVSVNAVSNTVGMQETGIPLPLMVLAILMVISGFLTRKRD